MEVFIMVKEEITINELLTHFKVNIKLPNNILDYVISGDFLKSDFKKDNEKYVFSVDDVVLTINPKDKKETIQYYVIIDEKIIGGFILGYENMQYLN